MGWIIIAIIILIAIKRADSPKKQKTNQNKSHQSQSSNPKSEWKWDEANKVWVHPDSIKPESIVKAGLEADNSDQSVDSGIDFTHAYQAQPLFTRNEWQNYKVLRDVANVKGYVVCPKVRLLDIVRPRNGQQKYKTLLYKIQSKHVDFVICDQNMMIKAVIELDDKTHDTERGKERDDFVDTVLRSVGYKVIHTRYINHDILDLI